MMNSPFRPLRRFVTEAERDRKYMQWVQKNGFPPKDYGCICCAELYCPMDCKGITDDRIKRIEND